MQPSILSLDALDDLDDPARGTYLPPEPLMPLPTAAAAEITFCTSWLTYMFGRAALAGIQPQISLEQAEQWAGRMGKAGHLQDFGDVQDAFQELALYGIEELLWKER
ncbi:hypothetical protein HYH02_000935 [Chlamydomonas schloesseri]|uniref:Uncharacterized protein n=1 Tax=Chlamydomonas schloesseri TaxID=2026947 RepID=A0A835WZL7_9CHLO|nr:hypothetical protein HYH02_000935 [Chlamydomonas schloesseri]|eukprot:KAG2455115.1 hypothetical protein HYH02_000935 [Chlamydomonas schloesseri]